MHLIVNGEPYEHGGDGSLCSLLSELGATPEHTALTVNGELLFSKDRSTCNLAEGDTVEVLTFVGGG